MIVCLRKTCVKFIYTINVQLLKLNYTKQRDNTCNINKIYLTFDHRGNQLLLEANVTCNLKKKSNFRVATEKVSIFTIIELIINLIFILVNSPSKICYGTRQSQTSINFTIIKFYLCRPCFPQYPLGRVCMASSHIVCFWSGETLTKQPLNCFLLLNLFNYLEMHIIIERQTLLF